jgi:hypothetical protein
MSIAPDSRLASSAAVFSITRTVILSKSGLAPYQVGLGSTVMWEPGEAWVTR